MTLSVRICILSLAAYALAAQDQTAGQRAYDSRCGRCHGGDGRGSDMAPSIFRGLGSRDDAQLAVLIRDGIPGKMPGSKVTGDELTALMAHARLLRTRARQRPVVRETVELTDGRKLEGELLGQGFTDKQLRSNGQAYLLRRATGNQYREVTSSVDWPGYNGDPRGNRYTEMTQITKANVGGLTVKWVFPIPNGARLQGTPVVVKGMMFVTDVNQCFALDAGTGRQIWHWRRPITPGTVGASSNRGVAVIGDRVFIATDHAHLVALNRHTGEEIWDVETADYRQNYFATGAPLAVGNLVLTGVGGGEHGTRGFVAAYDAQTGKEAWRFWTIPARGEPGSETWKGKDIDHGGAPTWLTGTYDPELDTIYWPIGNPAKEYEGKDREGDNLYSDCVVALDPKTGKLKWHFQFTPHDLWDWDATETPLLVNAMWEGKPRKLLLHGNRNGFFYVLDRTNGKVLLVKQFVKKLTWATGMTPEGRPIKAPNQEPSAKGTYVCPSQDGASNFYSPSYIPSTGLFYFQAFEKCSVYTTRDQGDWAPGKAYLGGSQQTAPGIAEHYLKALDIQTGKTVWELPQPGPAQGWGGTIATATGLIFFGEENGAMMAADATTGKPLWRFETNQNWKSSPMAYMFDGKQFIAGIAGGNVLAFGLPD
ncbi:MAG: PQQ-binding-like beta-propeller repeat protein [Bryobacteraceae bacterium]|nr:PQQ-binding-like beta-propeller repeat protein [Bryobacteraceae bacterium]